MACIRSSNSKKGSLEHTKPVLYPYFCLHIELLCFADILSKEDIYSNVYTLTCIYPHMHICLLWREKVGCLLYFCVRTLCRYWLLMFRSRLMEGANVISVKYEKSVTVLANLLWQKSLSLDRSAWDVDSELASELYERWQKIRRGEACRSVQNLLKFLIQASTVL